MSDVEQGRRELQIIRNHPEHVEVIAIPEHQLLRLGSLLHRGHCIAQTGRSLVVLVRSGARHLLRQVEDHRRRFATEEPQESVEVCLVVSGLHGADAWTAAPLDVEEQAGSLGPLVALELLVRARSKRERGQEEVDRSPEGTRVTKGSEVANSSTTRSARHDWAWPLLIGRDRQPGIALVILEANVVARLERLDQRDFEDQCLDLCGGGHPLNPLGRRHHLRSPGVQRARVLKVRAQSGSKRAGLSDVDHATEVVEELIAARLIRNGLGRWPQRHTPHGCTSTRLRL